MSPGEGGAANHACTYFDRGYLAQGLALWQSLARHDPAAELTVLALDDETAAALGRLGAGRVHVIPLAELLAADPELAAARAGRSRSEFIFALTPCLVRHVFRTRPGIMELLYLDADLFFFADPAPIRAELAAGSVLVVPHRYPKWHDDAPWFGRFNVGVVGFRRDAPGLACVEWWRESCLRSTALAAEAGCYGDQKYLDEWPGRFGGVIESRHPGVNVAPWNWAGHRFAIDPAGGVRVDGAPLVVFHFAQFRRIGGDWFDGGQLEYGIMPRGLRSRLYGRYWAALAEAERAIRGVLPDFSIPAQGWRATLGPWHLAALRLFWGQFWRRRGDRWVAGRLGLGRFSGRALSLYRRWRRAR